MRRKLAGVSAWVTHCRNPGVSPGGSSIATQKLCSDPMRKDPCYSQSHLEGGALYLTLKQTPNLRFKKISGSQVRVPQSGFLRNTSLQSCSLRTWAQLANKF